MKVEEGVMIIKGSKAWGVEYEDGQCTAYGWIAPEDAPIHDPRFCTKPTDVTYEKSPYVAELKTGMLVKVRRVTMVEYV